MRSKLTSLAVAAGILGALALPSGALAATAGTANISAGTLAFTTPSTVLFNATLTGVNQTVTAPQAIDVLDQTGSGAGWNVTATSTTFATTVGGLTLPNTSVGVAVAPTPVCDASSSCTLATTNVTYPYTLPAAAVAPTATKIYNATAGTGLGNQTATATMGLFVPSNTKAGSYLSTWTYSLVSAP